MESVQVKLCIGLIGVCIIAIIGDEHDGVWDDITTLGAEEWHESLPAHDKPIEGIYTLDMDVSFYEDDIVYKIKRVIK